MQPYCKTISKLQLHEDILKKNGLPVFMAGTLKLVIVLRKYTPSTKSVAHCVIKHTVS